MNRDDMLQRMRADSSPWDVLVVGGGATGLGVAVDAAARKYRTLLIEQGDFAQATSSRSTKLIHGGIRYLQQGQISLVRESLQERRRLLQNAPHLVHPIEFVLPSHQWWERAYYGVGVKLYDWLAGSLGMGSSQHLSRNATLQSVPNLRPEGLRGGILFYDAQFDDARMAIALAQTAADLGAVVVNYVKISGLIKEGGKISGVLARDIESGKEYELRARAVVNATGIFTDEIRRLDDRSSPSLLTYSQGAHVVLDQSFLGGKRAIISPRNDGRVFFAIPWLERTLIGTTESPIDKADVEPRPLTEEIDELLQSAAQLLVRTPTRADILSAFAGLRPLLRRAGHHSTSALPRSHLIEVSPAGLVTITGGKWTTYRRMAEHAVDQASVVGSLPRRPSITAGLRLHGGSSLTPSNPTVLAYGSDSNSVEQIFRQTPAGQDLLHPQLPYRVGEVTWAARHEMALTVADVLSRRTRALFLDAKASMSAAPQVARLLAAECKRSEKWQQEQVSAFLTLAKGYLPP